MSVEEVNAFNASKERRFVQLRNVSDAIAEVDAIEHRIAALRKDEIRERFDLKAHRVKLRVEVLDRLVKDRVCPKCLGVKVSSRRWVVFQQDQKNWLTTKGLGKLANRGVVCRSCWWKIARVHFQGNDVTS